MSRASKVVLITGCSQGGIGFALCEEFAFQGCRVYATARRLEAMEGFQHPRIQKLVLDVLDDENVDAVVKTIVEAEGRIDVLVNNAGAMCAGAMLDIPLDQVRRVFETNTFSILRVAKAVVPHMAKRQSGTIVNIGSIVGETPTPWNGMYSATKSAVHTISDVLWMECKPFNINVSLVVPGAVRSNISANQQTSFSIPENSLYKPYTQQIIARITTSQGSESMPAEEFAKRVARASLLKSPPRYLTLGGKSWVFQLFKWLPRTWVLVFLWMRFSKPRK